MIRFGLIVSFYIFLQSETRLLSKFGMTLTPSPLVSDCRFCWAPNKIYEQPLIGNWENSLPWSLLWRPLGYSPVSVLAPHTTFFWFSFAGQFSDFTSGPFQILIWVLIVLQDFATSYWGEYFVHLQELIQEKYCEEKQACKVEASLKVSFLNEIFPVDVHHSSFEILLFFIWLIVPPVQCGVTAKIRLS